MRPRNPTLREQYITAAAALRALNRPVTPQTLSLHLPKPYNAVRTFLNRNPTLVAEITLETGSTWMSTIPHIREITVQHFDSTVLRVVLNKVSPAKYIQLWDEKHLLFQMKGVSKPEYLPTREEMVKFL